MGYSHGTYWTDDKIKNAIKEVVEKTKINSMPSRSLMDEVTGSTALSNTVVQNIGLIS